MGLFLIDDNMSKEKILVTSIEGNTQLLDGGKMLETPQDLVGTLGKC